MNHIFRKIALLTLVAASFGASAQGHKDSAIIALHLEPAGLDPTSAPGAAIGETVLYNVLEGLTKVNMDGTVTPLLAESWQISSDGKRYTFKLRPDVKFQDGESFSAADVKFSFERAKADGSTNRAKKTVFDNIAGIDTPDPHSVVLRLNSPDGNLLFRLGESSAVILDAKSAATTRNKPVGTGPYQFGDWKKGASLTLIKWPGYRDAAAVRLNKVIFRFISDPAAQVAALLAGDVDAMPRFQAPQSLAQFQHDARFSVTVGGTEGKVIVAINNRKKPLDDIRVRRAIAMAVDRHAVITAATEGYGKPIGSHMVPNDVGYVDTTAVNPYDPARARALLKEAGVSSLNLTLTLPPPAYAHRSGEIVAAQLAKVGINVKIENVEMAQWLSSAFKGNFDLTIISHVEPLDFGIYANPKYYFGYDSQTYRDLLARYNASTNTVERMKLLGELQKQLATDSVNVFMFQLPQLAVAKKNLKGLWSSSPVSANDMAKVHWD